MKAWYHSSCPPGYASRQCGRPDTYVEHGALLSAVTYAKPAERGARPARPRPSSDRRVLVIPKAISNSIQWKAIGILRVLLLNVEREEGQEFWANYPVFPHIELIAVKFPAGTPLGRVNAILAAKFRIPLIHVATRCCSLRAAHVLLSAGADETAVDARGQHASDLVGDFQAGDNKKDAARERGFRRMLQRGPAFRARSWTWTVETNATVSWRSSRHRPVGRWFSATCPDRANF